MQFLLNNLGQSSEGKNGSGILSMDEIRNAARMLGDISSSNHGSSLIQNSFNFLNISNPDNMIVPLKLDFNNFGVSDDVPQAIIDDNFEAVINDY